MTLNFLFINPLFHRTAFASWTALFLYSFLNLLSITLIHYWILHFCYVGHYVCRLFALHLIIVVKYLMLFLTRFFNSEPILGLNPITQCIKILLHLLAVIQKTLRCCIVGVVLKLVLPRSVIFIVILCFTLIWLVCHFKHLLFVSIQFLFKSVHFSDFM